MFQKRENVHIFTILHALRLRFQTVFHGYSRTTDSFYLDVQQCGFAGRSLSHLRWCDIHETFLQWYYVFFFSDARSRVVSNQTFLPETIDFLICSCFMNIKMKNNNINVDTSFRHSKYRVHLSMKDLSARVRAYFSSNGVAVKRKCFTDMTNMLFLRIWD